MTEFNLFKNGIISDILCENTTPKGIKLVAATVANDLSLVTKKEPKITSDLKNITSPTVIIAAVNGQSTLSENLSKRGLLDLSPIEGKRECYLIKPVETPFLEYPKIKQALFIVGSDKRGTIYGMFNLSRLCGVSPLIFWGDAAPDTKDEITLKFENPIITKEPSVKYRGFFINDEWPAFGRWCTERYGDVNAKAYKMIFELVLRLNGNYLWPAMWNSSFSEEGPGIENARLADEYGVIMGTSHHEPLCRAGVEWQRQYQKYGDDNTWSFVTNEAAITEFWKDGILRNKDYESIITIGMRGENDSLLMGRDASIQDNIDVLKRAITVQNRLIKEHINPDLKAVPRMMAIYKEVEDFYFGIEGTKGLKGFAELEDVILLYSDDNYGNLRAIPDLNEKPHSGGLGIYYHFDYHGAPYSYEWLNFTNLPKAWEQLTMAYEYGIRDMWIVNVGDIKGKEYPLSFFMSLAYDYEKWGVNNLNSAAEFTELWINEQFGKAVSPKQKTCLKEILEAYTMWTTVRIPEAINPDVFKNNFHEIENVLNAAGAASKKATELRSDLPENCLTAYDSMIYYPVKAFLNSLMLNLTAALNHLNAKRGALIANEYGAKLKELIAMDKYYCTEFHKILGGKWNHMMDSAHMCFLSWDDNRWQYPLIMAVEPIPYPKIIVSFRGYSGFNTGYHWQDIKPLCNSDLTRPDKNAIILDIDSRSDIDYQFTLSCDKEWLKFSQSEGKSNLIENPRISIEIIADRTKLDGEETALVKIGFAFINGEYKEAFLNVEAGNNDYPCHPAAFLETQNYLSIPADGYVSKTDVGKMGFETVPRLGRCGNAVKSFPVTKSWVNDDSRPYLTYEFILNQTKDYEAVFFFSPRNPMIKGGKIRAYFSFNDAKPELLNTIPTDFYAEHYNADWSLGVTNNIRKVITGVSLNKGLNRLKFYAADPNVILEHIVIYPKDKPLPEIHLPPPDSYRI